MNMNNYKNITVIKKDGTREEFNPDKIVKAISKSAERVQVTFTDSNIKRIINHVTGLIDESEATEIPIKTMHNYVESALDIINPLVAKSYRDYRNYKQDFVHILDSVYKNAQAIMYIGDKDNANTDSALVATKRCLTYNYLNKELYQKFFLNALELQACKEGFIYIHDMSARRDTMNCCLFDMASVLKDGFEMGNLWYNEPKTLDVAFDVIGDLILSVAAQQYGGFTVPEIDSILAPYAEKSYHKYYNELVNELHEILGITNITNDIHEKLDKKASDRVRYDFMQGFQGLEYKLNSVGSSRGDYPFTTITFGLNQSKFGVMASECALLTRQNGQGKAGKKKVVLFPKLVFLYDENLHGEGKPFEDLFNKSIECSQKSLYPDYLSLTGEGYVSEMYKKYGKAISPMGCRAFLSPWYERGGMTPADENDKPVFIGRFNGGAISLHLPLIYAQSQKDSKDFFEVLDYYLEMIRKLHIKTYDYIGEMRASVNPVAYCEGGFLGGHLKPTDKIKPLLKSATFSFGITALNELQQLYNKKSLVEDGEFALKVLKYINDKVNKFKEEDGILYAIYGTPAESLATLQVTQFRKKFGIIENVSDRSFMSNSFHCFVGEEISPIEKQDLEKRFWDYSNGGKIQYCRYPLSYNKEAFKQIVRRAMKYGFYEGCNMALCYCDDCGYEQLEMEECPECGSKNITQIDRVCGYLGFTKVKGDTRVNYGKYEEITKYRKSM